MENYTRVEAMDKIEELEERLGKIRLPSPLVMCGNLVFAKCGEEGSTTGLTAEDIVTVERFLASNQSKVLEARESWRPASGFKVFVF